jgi:Cu-processing system ATP-binding protein
MNDRVIQISHVKLDYGKIRALNDISLNVAAGEVIGLLGHNGAGKTTAMKILLGLIKASAGDVKVFGENPSSQDHANQIRNKIGYLPENLSFYPQLTGTETLSYFAGLKGAKESEQKQLMEDVGLSHAADRKLKTYSKGMRQRLGLAQALLNKPGLLILDEPTVGLDPVATRDLYSKIDMLKQQGTTVILCSHVLAGIEEHIDRAVILANGRVLADGDLQSLRQKTQLPMRIRVQGSIQENGWLRDISNNNVSLKRINGSQYVFTCPVSEKISLLKNIMAEDQVNDLEVDIPSLESIYQYYSSQVSSFEVINDNE